MAGIAKQLRQAVLQAAIQGKLTEQLPEDGDARDLLVKIKQCDSSINGQRVKAKEILEIGIDDEPFNIPNNWKWIRLGAVCIVARGGSPRPIKDYITDSPDGINWIKIGDTEKNGKYIIHTAEKIKAAGVSKSRLVHSGDFLLTNSMSFGRPYILKTDGCIHDGWLVISQPIKVYDENYLYWLLSSNFAYCQFSGKVSGAVVKNLNSDKVANSILPLPPLAEQHRIVARVEELMAKIDELEKVENELNTLHKAFPGDMKAALLQAAMQGKLTEQLPEDGNAEDLLKSIEAEKAKLIAEKKIKKQKVLELISEEDAPLQIPSNWSWAYIGDIFSHNAGKALNAKNQVGNKHKYITTSNVYWDHFELANLKEMYYTDDEVEKYSVKKGDLLVLEGGDIGRSAIWNLDVSYCIQNHLHCLRPYLASSTNVKYYYYLMMLYKQIGAVNGKGIAIQGLSANALHSIVVPVAPLAEQQRIVEKLDKLLPLCDSLEEKL